MSPLLQDWVAEHAERRPGARAVTYERQHLTYGELEIASNRLAHLLQSAGCRRGDRVCLVMPKSPMAIVAILGVLKADAIYVPLDPASPARRLASMITSCDTRWILAGGHVPVLNELAAMPGFDDSHRIGWLDIEPPPAAIGAEFSLRDLMAFQEYPPSCANQGSDTAHLLFTSGSTGVPKGVVVTHDSVRHFVNWAVPYFGIRASDRISGHPPLHFDLSTFDIFGSFAAGAELHLIPPALNMLPHKLAELIRNEELTQWFSVPSVLNYMAKFDAVESNDFPALRRVLWCGETLPTPTLIHWMRRLPHASFTNLYGPTEATVASSYYRVPECPVDESESIPIGRACAGEELLVLDDALHPVPQGQVGELYIAGVGLSPGYWRDPEKTQQAFLSYDGAETPERIYRTGDLASVDDEGLVHFAGRADTQIKSRGYRVELGEVETALHALGALRECAALGVASDGFDGTAIACAFVPLDGDAVTPNWLREHLAQSLPAYMLPTRWMALKELPKTGNGKIDRRALRDQFSVDVVGESVGTP